MASMRSQLDQGTASDEGCADSNNLSNSTNAFSFSGQLGTDCTDVIDLLWEHIPEDCYELFAS